jgi:hypothetical protein
MSNDRKLPVEIVQFESLLKKPNSDPTGFAGFFNSGEIVVTRVPARLDVMGALQTILEAMCVKVFWIGEWPSPCSRAQTERCASEQYRRIVKVCPSKHASPSTILKWARGSSHTSTFKHCVNRILSPRGRHTSAAASLLY